MKRAEAEALVSAMLEHIGDFPRREGLLDTPRRVVDAWGEWFSGYGQHPQDVLKSFEDGAAGYTDMVILDNIPVQSHCEHHLAPFVGTAIVGYIPNGRIVGLSKIPRLVDIYAKRLQVQERLTNQIVTALMDHLNPKGAGVVIKAEHFCLTTRGACKPGVITTTSALQGNFLIPEVRAEFLSLRRR